LGEFNQATEQFSGLISSRPKSDLADDAQYALGWIWFQTKGYTEAIKEFRRLIDAYPRSELLAISWYSIGDAHYNLKQYAEAEAAYRRVITAFPESPLVADALTGVQYCMTAQGKAGDAIGLIDEHIRKNPSSPSAAALSLKKAELLFQQGNFASAESEYASFAGKNPVSPQSATAYFWAGRSARARKKYSDAAAYFEKASVVPNSPGTIAAEALLEAGSIYRLQNNDEGALRVFSKVEQDFPGTELAAEASYQKGLVFYDNDDVLETKNQFEYVLRSASAFAAADKSKIGLARLYLKEGNQKNALLYAKEVATSRTDSLGAEAQYLVGEAYMEAKDWEAAVTAFLRMKYLYAREEQWMAKSYLTLGEAYIKLNEPKRAQDAFQTVLKYESQQDAVEEARKQLNRLERGK
jgi:TolA-binding protein